MLDQSFLFVKLQLTCNGNCHTDDTGRLGQLCTWSPEFNKFDETWITSSIHGTNCE